MQKNNKWESGIAPISVIILTLNEAHHLDSLLLNLKGWGSQIFIVDS